MTRTFGVWTDSRGLLRVEWDFGDGTAPANRHPRLNLGHRYVCDGTSRCVLCGSTASLDDCPENNA